MVAISVLGALALGEVGAVGWAVYSKFHVPAAPDLASLGTAPDLPVASPNPALPGAATSAVSPTVPTTAKQEPPPSAQPAFTDPFASAAAASVSPASAAASQTATPTEQPLAALPKPTPIPQMAESPESRINDLIAQARALRERGDTSTAITKLREGLNIAPDSPLLISELATTYEKMGLDQKALEQWRRIYDLGESAGIFYAAADAKLKNNELSTHPAGSPAAQGSASQDGMGIQPGSVLGLVNPQIVEQSDPAAQKKFTLKIPLRSKPNTRIEVSDVVIQVFFYDQLSDGSIVQTNANVSSHWSTLPADWLEDDIEILEVDYTQPKVDSAKTGEDRRYYGYVVRVYYKKDLQDMRADPVALLRKYPPPLTIQSGGDAQ
jgi:tetratricopeptide (TPR) repeat protein